MSFENLVLKSAYDSDEDNILDDFYIPLISMTMRYDRLAGYFSSTVLAMTAKGMANFIRNNGKMRLVTCVQLTEQDRKAIESGLAEPEEAISKIMMTGLDLADQIQRDHVAALAWMIAQKNLEIKIAVPVKEDGVFVTEMLDKDSVFHQKVGILQDANHNVVTFSGSVNETKKAWIGNIEEFKVFCSWKSGQSEYASTDAKKFEKFWYGLSKNTKVFDLPTAIREHLLSNAPKSIDEAVAKITHKITPPTLRDYQKEAVDRWLENNRRGIFEMATGTGKTHTAISCIQKINAEQERNLVVITCPYRHLIVQWTEELQKWGMDDVVRADSANLSWKQDIGEMISHLNDGIIDNGIIVTTHDTFSRELFIDIIRHLKVRSFLVADEVHNLGAEKRSEGLLDAYTLRLGLSATPERYLDDVGTQKIFDYFDRVVYKFDLDRAIRDNHLTHYKLFPHIVYMTDDESEQYYDFSKQLAIERSKKEPDFDRIRKLNIQRSKIIKVAKNKIDKFEEILRNMLEDNNGLDHCLVYCAHNNQLDDVAAILHKMKIIFHRFTMRETPEDRKKLLLEFNDGTKDVLIAIKCLDEGVDVPSTHTAIILASSHNPREFIQRRGRLLRVYLGKKYATIHDLIVLPKNLSSQVPTESEKSAILGELGRLQEFADSSDNPEISRNLIQTLMNRYGLS